MAIYPIIIVFLWTLIPALELRASIPIGILKYDLSWQVAFITATAANILIAPITYLFLDKVMHIFRRIRWIDKVYRYYVERTQKKIHDSVEKYGEWALALFIGVPLPATGIYSGMLAAYVMGLDFKRSMIAAALGVLIAAVIVTVVTLTGAEAWSFLMKA